MSNMVWLPEHIIEMASFLSNLKTGDLIEVIKYKIIGLKFSQLNKGM